MGWFGLALLILGANDVVRWLTGHSFQVMHDHRWKIGGFLLLVAQTIAYHDLLDEKHAVSIVLQLSVPRPPDITITRSGSKEKDDQIANLRNQLDDRKQRKDRRDRIATFTDEGLKLMQACDAHIVPLQELENKIVQWSDAVFKYLKTQDASWASTFSSAQGPTFTNPIRPGEYNDAWN